MQIKKLQQRYQVSILFGIPNEEVNHVFCRNLNKNNRFICNFDNQSLRYWTNSTMIWVIPRTCGMSWIVQCILLTKQRMAPMLHYVPTRPTKPIKLLIPSVQQLTLHAHDVLKFNILQQNASSFPRKEFEMEFQFYSFVHAAMTFYAISAFFRMSTPSQHLIQTAIQVIWKAKSRIFSFFLFKKKCI